LICVKQFPTITRSRNTVVYKLKNRPVLCHKLLTGAVSVIELSILCPKEGRVDTNGTGHHQTLFD